MFAPHIAAPAVPVAHVAPALRYRLVAPQNIRPFAAQVSTFTRGLNVYAAPYAAGVLNSPAIVTRALLPGISPVPPVPVAAAPLAPVPALAPAPVLPAPAFGAVPAPIYPAPALVPAPSPLFPAPSVVGAPLPVGAGPVFPAAPLPVAPAAVFPGAPLPVAAPAPVFPAAPLPVAPAPLLPSPFARSVHAFSPSVHPHAALL